MKGFQDPFFIYLTNNHTHTRKRKRKEVPTQKAHHKLHLKAMMNLETWMIEIEESF